MALVLKERIATGTLLGVWKKEEAVDLLENVYLLSASEEQEYYKIRNINRRQEWLTVRVLLTEMLTKKQIIIHNENGRPFLKDSKTNISISHSKNYVTIVISSSYMPGVDIETISGRAEKVKHKFLTKKELEWCKTDIQLTGCWSAKETIFKLYEKNLDFKDMEVGESSFTEEHGVVRVVVTKTGYHNTFAVKYRLVENDILTYVVLKGKL